MTWHATIITLFPELFPGSLGASLAGKGLHEKIWQLNVVNLRDYATDKHRTVDDTPYGGGAGMVLKPDITAAALRHADQTFGPHGRRIYLSPRGKPLNQPMVEELAKQPVLLLCGRYEGVDERVIEAAGLEEVSLGDFVLSGGEVAALALIEATIRLLPGLLGNQETLAEESFSQGLLEYPHYTRPPVWEGREVPPVLLGGDHAAIAAWRQSAARKLTRERRPDLWQNYLQQQLATSTPNGENDEFAAKN
ncbi:MAG: tRNA (guanosine(37)-N1)-methyltransferase TrmD [Alphaproteobacteria bacterium]|nr:tRNA (guanosine(37)-N1)-methyltransferase TrmD [Alphaproteobacteria bacterium]NDC55950.1 tRNA (guanosine(37)-N1)-methyltransferase TrmD [Alphaproteobacteria bacterium]NDG04105.1 tRNA (guanosine(37)-N1)-methyltransferase TrmD [Alphaproteobacteria bacterium]